MSATAPTRCCSNRGGRDGALPDAARCPGRWAGWDQRRAWSQHVAPDGDKLGGGKRRVAAGSWRRLAPDIANRDSDERELRGQIWVRKWDRIAVHFWGPSFACTRAGTLTRAGRSHFGTAWRFQNGTVFCPTRPIHPEAIRTRCAHGRPPKLTDMRTHLWDHKCTVGPCARNHDSRFLAQRVVKNPSPPCIVSATALCRLVPTFMRRQVVPDQRCDHWSSQALNSSNALCHAGTQLPREPLVIHRHVHSISHKSARNASLCEGHRTFASGALQPYASQPKPTLGLDARRPLVHQRVRILWLHASMVPARGHGSCRLAACANIMGRILGSRIRI